MSDPKGPKFTAEQEAEYMRYELAMTRARIMERGVAVFLNIGDFASASEIEEAATILSESVALRIEAETKRAEIRNTAQDSDPRPTVKRRRVKPRTAK